MPSADSWCAGLEKLKVFQLAGCTNDSLASFRQLQLEGGFCIPTSELQVGPFNALAEASCTGLLLYETESQLLHGLWRSTRAEQSGGEVCCPCLQLRTSSPVFRRNHCLRGSKIQKTTEFGNPMYLRRSTVLRCSFLLFERHI